MATVRVVSSQSVEGGYTCLMFGICGRTLPGLLQHRIFVHHTRHSLGKLFHILRSAQCRRRTGAFMSHRVCPWWLGYFLLNPFHKRSQNPHALLSPYVREGMTVLEPGPGMGFFTAELAKLVGASGRVICVDVQSKMIDKLKRRLAKLKLNGRVDARLALPDSMGLADLLRLRAIHSCLCGRTRISGCRHVLRRSRARQQAWRNPVGRRTKRAREGKQV